MSLIIQTALKAQKKTKPWILDSGCSSHMTGDKEKFDKLEPCDGGSVRFGNNDGAKIIGKGSVSLYGGRVKSHEVMLVSGLKHSLLSVSQIARKGHNVNFDNVGCEIRKKETGKLVAKGVLTEGNLYVLIEGEENLCLMSSEGQNKLWHRRMGHINFKNLSRLCSRNAVRDLSKLR